MTINELMKYCNGDHYKAGQFAGVAERTMYRYVEKQAWPAWRQALAEKNVAADRKEKRKKRRNE